MGFDDCIEDELRQKQSDKIIEKTIYGLEEFYNEHCDNEPDELVWFAQRIYLKTTTRQVNKKGFSQYTRVSVNYRLSMHIMPKMQVAC
jgi:hypothetical protein